MNYLIEFKIVAIVISFWAIYSALVARMNITQIPFVQILLYPEHFGGKVVRWRYLWWLFVWVLLANISAFAIASIIKLAEIPTSKLYELINYESASGGQAGLITTLIATVALYNYIVRKSHRIAFEMTSNAHSHLLNERIEDEPSKPRLNLKKPKDLLNILFYLLPNLYAQVYLYFYRECHNIIADGCVQYVCENYGHERILNFYEYSRESQSSSTQCNELNTTLGDIDPEDKNYVHVIVTALIRMRGFHNAKVEIENYILSLPVVPRDYESRRNERIKLVKPRTISFTNGKVGGKCKIYEWSKNGCFLAVKRRVCVNAPVMLKIGSKEIRAQHVHRNAQVFDGKIIRGIGIEIIDINEWGMYERSGT